MISSNVLYFPEVISDSSYEMVSVLISQNGQLNTLVELSKESLDAIKRIAEISGTDYLDYLRDISRDVSV